MYSTKETWQLIQQQYKLLADIFNNNRSFVVMYSTIETVTRPKWVLNHLSFLCQNIEIIKQKGGTSVKFLKVELPIIKLDPSLGMQVARALQQITKSHHGC